MENNLEIRLATKEDADEVGRVHVLASRATYRGIYTDEYLEALCPRERAYRWREEGKGHLALDNPEFAVFVAFEGDRIIGFADIGPSDSTVQAELYALYVDPEYIGKGVGKALFQASVQHAEMHGFKAVSAQVLSGNVLARAFYERMGGAALRETERMVEAGGTLAPVLTYYWPAPQP